MTLFEFTTETSAQAWHPENDVVMGGVSSGELTYVAETDTRAGAGRFSGNVSLENNGGFAQILYDKMSFDLKGFQGLELQVKGDNKTYELRLETTAERVAYTHAFLANAQWQQLRLAFADFKPTFHGGTVPDAPELDLAAVQTVGFLIGNEQEGEFELLLGKVTTYES